MMNDSIIYLDHNATTPVDPRVLEVMLPYFTDIYGNAASIDHEAGHRAKRAVEKARVQCAKLIGARIEKHPSAPDATKEIIFTSGATESDNIALFGVAERYAHKGDHIITCVTEHKAVLDCCQRLEKMGKRVTYLGVDQYGFIDLDELRRAITLKTILISIMFANNEIGTIQPIAEIGKIAREHGIIFHTDAAQAMGHVPIDVEKMNIDLLSFSAHKIYGPKGVGGLYVRRRKPRVKLTPVIYGGGHELGLRSGTLNVPGIVGMGVAFELAGQVMSTEALKYRKWAQLTFDTLSEKLARVELNGAQIGTDRLPSNINVSINGIESKSLVVQVKNQVAIATGSACTTVDTKPSHVIRSLGFGEDRAHNAVRIGFGRALNINKLNKAISILISSSNKLAQLSI
ncbi:MAG: cysteine desulfurase family protein [Candidatus Promineifilaceae bacterium]